jgi:hypothetical protein
MPEVDNNKNKEQLMKLLGISSQHETKTHKNDDEEI